MSKNIEELEEQLSDLYHNLHNKKTHYNFFIEDQKDFQEFDYEKQNELLNEIKTIENSIEKIKLVLA